MNLFPGTAAVRAMSRYWWIFVLRGVLAISFGVVAWAWPSPTLNALLWLAGFWLVFDGVFAISGAIVNRSKIERVWTTVLAGLAAVLLGLFILAYPDFTAIWLIVTIGIYAIFSGVLAIIDAISLRREIDNEWSMGLFGLVSIIFGFLMMAFPGEGAISLIWVIGIYAILIGILQIVLGLRIRNLPAGA